MNATIRYAIQITRPEFPNVGVVARAVGLNSEGGFATFLEDGKTFASEASAQRWMDSRPDWMAWRRGQRNEIKIIPVRMKRGSTTVAVAAA